MMKDFLWWLLKENYLINFIYREFFHYLFPIKNIENVTKSVVIDKSYIQSSYSKKKPLLSIKGYTSGTTNNPLTVYRSFKSILLEEYIVKSYLKEIGVPLRPKIAILRGDNIKTEGSIFWKMMPFSKRLVFSSYHISEKTASCYLLALEEYQPDIIFAYPSSIVLLAKYAQKLNWKPNWGLVGIFTSSELFNSTNQAIVKSIFGNVFDHYGQAERVAVLQQCLQGNYHVRTDYSKVEFLTNKHGTHIVGSNFYNKAMPLTRYDTKDYVEGFSQNGDCLCGNKSDYVKSILGRDDDYVILKDGRHIGRLDVAFKGIKQLIECQLKQTSLSKIIILYVPELNADINKLEYTIESQLREYLDNDITIKLEKVDKVPRTKSGKFRSVIRDKGIESV